VATQLQLTNISISIELLTKAPLFKQSMTDAENLIYSSTFLREPL